MDRGAVLVTRAAWHVAEVVATRAETATAQRIEFEIPTWPGSDAGAHLDVRLTAPDGYQAERSYSMASAGPGTRVAIAVEELPDGEVSPFLVRELQVGDRIEVRGPLGAHFVWRSGDERPVQLLAGGSGVVPLYAIATAHRDAGSAAPMRLLYSARGPATEYFRAELPGLGIPVDHVYTRAVPEGWPGPPARLTRDRLAERTIPAAERPRVYVCGPTPFVEIASRWLLDLGHDAGNVLTERFGGSAA